MDEDSIVNENVSVLLDQLLNSKDPATIGIKRILKRKVEERNDFPLRTPRMESFDQQTKQGERIFTDDERRVLELEKKVRDLEAQMIKQEEHAKKALQESYIKGKQEGFKAGEKQGRESASAEYEKSLDQVQKQVASFLEKVQDSKKEVIHNLEHVLLKFSLELSKRIIASEVSTRGDLILSVVKKSLNIIADREKLVIRVSPDDLQTVSGRRDFWSSVTERLENVNIESDERIEKGGCIIESNSGMVDARLGVQMEEMAELVQKAWENADISLNSSES